MLSERFLYCLYCRNCPESFTIHFYMSREVIYVLFHMSRQVIYALFYMSREVYLRASSGKFLRVKSCCPESFRFLCLWWRRSKKSNMNHLWDAHHIFEGRVEVFDILRTFCLRRKTIIHVEEYHATGFRHVAEKHGFRSRKGYLEMRLSWILCIYFD